MARKTQSRSKFREQSARREDSRHSVRPFWSGTISFGLVSVPVNLFPAMRSARASLRMLDQDGTPLERRYYCPEDEREVHPEHVIRGFEIADGQYVIIRDDELESLEPDKSSDIDLVCFVDPTEIPHAYFDRPYFLTPAGKSNKAYRLLAQVMEDTHQAGIATFVMRGREYLVAILAGQGILRAETLRFADEIRSPEDVDLPEPEKSARKVVTEFSKAIEKHTARKLDRALLRDPFPEQLRQLARRKMAAGEKPVEISTSETTEHDKTDYESTGVDLLETIRKSIGGKSYKRGASPTSSGGKSAAMEELSKEQLYERAQQTNIPGRSQMTKQQLIKALQSH